MDFNDRPDGRKGQLLKGLSKAALTRVNADLELQSMKVRDQIDGPNHPVTAVYFPINCVLSTVAHGAGGEIVEVATVGNEGMSGISAFLGVERSNTLDSFCQLSGDAMRMSVAAFKGHLAREPALHKIMGAYTQALLTQISQASACNRMHPVAERCARWLLMTHDRVLRDEFELTHEFLGQMLGVRRATVGEVAGKLQEKGIIRYTRGRITILDRPALASSACECYEIILDEYARLLPDPPKGAK